MKLKRFWVIGTFQILEMWFCKSRWKFLSVALAIVFCFKSVAAIKLDKVAERSANSLLESENLEKLGVVPHEEKEIASTNRISVQSAKETDDEKRELLASENVPALTSTSDNCTVLLPVPEKNSTVPESHDLLIIRKNASKVYPSPNGRLTMASEASPTTADPASKEETAADPSSKEETVADPASKEETAADPSSKEETATGQAKKEETAAGQAKKGEEDECKQYNDAAWWASFFTNLTTTNAQLSDITKLLKLSKKPPPIHILKLVLATVEEAKPHSFTVTGDKRELANGNVPSVTQSPFGSAEAFSPLTAQLREVPGSTWECMNEDLPQDLASQILDEASAHGSISAAAPMGFDPAPNYRPAPNCGQLMKDYKLDDFNEPSLSGIALLNLIRALRSRNSDTEPEQAQIISSMVVSKTVEVESLQGAADISLRKDKEVVMSFEVLQHNWQKDLTIMALAEFAICEVDPNLGRTLTQNVIVNRLPHSLRHQFFEVLWRSQLNQHNDNPEKVVDKLGNNLLHLAVLSHSSEMVSLVIRRLRLAFRLEAVVRMLTAKNIVDQRPIDIVKLLPCSLRSSMRAVLKDVYNSARLYIEARRRRKRQELGLSASGNFGRKFLGGFD